MPRAIFSEIPGHPTNMVPGLPGVSFTSFDRPFRSPDGSRWIISAQTNAPSPALEVIVTGIGFAGPRALLAQETVTPIDGVRTCDSGGFDLRLAINDSGNSAFACSLDGATTDDEVIVKHVGGSFGIAAQEGTSTAPLIPNAFLGITLNSSSITNGNAISYLGSSLTGSGVTSTTNAALFLNSNAALAAQKGVTIPTGMGVTNPWETFNADDYYVSANGTKWLAAGDTTGATTSDGIVVLNNEVVIREGSPPVPGLDPVLTIVESIMMSDGNWFVRTSEAAGTGGEDALVRSAVLLAQTDDLVPGGLPGERFSDTLFSQTFFWMQGNNLGDYVYGGTTDNPDPNRDAVMVFNNTTVVARQGDPVDLDGNGIFDDDAFIDIFNNDDGFLTDSRELYFTADLKNGAGTSLGQAYLVLQVPEPATLSLLGLVALALRRRMR